MSLIAPAAKSLGDGGGLSKADFLARLERASVVATLDNLKSFPWIKSRADDRQLQLLGAYFDVSNGALEVYDPNVGVFTHPFFAVSKDDGSFEIKGLPPGTYELEAWHSTLGTKTVSVTVPATGSATAEFSFGTGA